eukprot:TRINITY_DN4416_c0_g5_i2.p1 TRINITY_DN4416_c0_g5~~TRINITY_DN4416_c0_g5_i2.p1  ORF type:complete len:447 (+),score=17.96 TRINITY_DN4416_c0_g5_i2:62-1402(+)
MGNRESQAKAPPLTINISEINFYNLKCQSGGYLFAESPGSPLKISDGNLLPRDGHLFGWSGKEIVSKHSTAECIWVVDVDPKTSQVITAPRNNAPSQQWTSFPHSEGAISILTETHTCIEANRDTNQIVLSLCSQSTSQLWMFQDAEENTPHEFMSFPAHVFDSKTNKWMPHKQSVRGNDEKNELDDLNFLTWNVWFSKHRWDERLPVLFKIMGDINPTFICLQEVTPDFLRSLLDCDWVRERYAVSDISGSTVSPYGVLMLCRAELWKALVGFNLYFLPTMMCRKLLVAKLRLGDTDTRVATVHLESMRSAPVRVQQIQIAMDVLAPASNAFFMGDFNFDPSLPDCIENTAMGDGFVDIWHHLYPDQKGHTHCHGGRIDRIAARTADFVPHNIQIIGNGTIEGYRFDNNGNPWPALPERQHHGPDARVRSPSDHYGLLSSHVVRQ